MRNSGLTGYFIIISMGVWAGWSPHWFNFISPNLDIAPLPAGLVLKLKETKTTYTGRTNQAPDGA